MKAVKMTMRIGVWLLLVVIGLWWQPIGAPCEELQPIKIELDSCLPSFFGKEIVCLVPIFRLSNPNSQMVLATIDYTLSRAGNLLGGGQMPSFYIPARTSIQQRDTAVVVFMPWLIRVISSGKSPPEAMQTILPLWKGMGGEEPPNVPEGLWPKIPAITPPIVANGSMSLRGKGGKEKIFFFEIQREESE
jgi:hypothetical protein